MRSLLARTFPLLAILLFGGHAVGQTQNYFGTSGALNGNVWSTNPAGPYTAPLATTGGAVINFGNAATFNGGDITVSGINATANASLIGTAIGTISNVNDGVIPINVASGATLDFVNQSFTSAATAGYIKNGDGVLALAGNTYAGGFTLNAGTVIVRGVNALGGGATNTLTLNGGILASNSNRDLGGKYGGGITIGGNVQFGDTVGLAGATRSLTFSDAMSLGSSARTLTVGNGSTHIFGGVISNGVVQGSDAITFAVSATAGPNGRFDLTNTANTFTGNIRIIGGEVRATADGSLGNANNSITIDGGRLSTLSGAAVTLGSSRNIFVGDAAGTSISAPGTGAVLTYNGVIANVTGKTGSWEKQGPGTMVLGGASTYTGTTTVLNGTLRLAAAGSIHHSTAITVGPGATYDVGSVSGGYTLGSLTAQTLQGTGTVIGTVNIAAGSTLRGGSATTSTGTLNLASTTLNGAATLAVDLNGNANPTIAVGSNSLLSFGSNSFNLVSTNGKFNIRLLNDAELTVGQSYTLNLASGSQFRRNGGAANFTDADFNLQSGSGAWAFNNVSLAVSGSNLQLTFEVAPVPEPATVLAIGAAGLGLAGWVRRRRRATA